MSNESYHMEFFCDINLVIIKDNKSKQKDISIRMVGLDSTKYKGEQYITQLYNQLLSHNIFQESESLLLNIIKKTTPTEQSVDKMQKMDSIITIAMLKAEQDSCKKKDAVLWSPKIIQSHVQLCYWNLCIKSLQQNCDADTRLKSILKIMTKESIEQIRIYRKTVAAAYVNALKEHKKIMQNKSGKQRKYLESCLEDLRGRKNEEKTTLTQIMRQEETRQDFQIHQSKANKRNHVS
jgi:hypothetical protein